MSIEALRRTQNKKPEVLYERHAAGTDEGIALEIQDIDDSVRAPTLLNSEIFAPSRVVDEKHLLNIGSVFPRPVQESVHIRHPKLDHFAGKESVSIKLLRNGNSGGARIGPNKGPVREENLPLECLPVSFRVGIDASERPPLSIQFKLDLKLLRQRVN